MYNVKVESKGESEKDIILMSGYVKVDNREFEYLCYVVVRRINKKTKKLKVQLERYCSRECVTC